LTFPVVDAFGFLIHTFQWHATVCLVTIVLRKAVLELAAKELTGGSSERVSDSVKTVLWTASLQNRRNDTTATGNVDL